MHQSFSADEDDDDEDEDTDTATDALCGRRHNLFSPFVANRHRPRGRLLVGWSATNGTVPRWSGVGGLCLWGFICIHFLWHGAQDCKTRPFGYLPALRVRVIALFNNLNNAVRNRVAAPICRGLPGCGLRAGMIHKLPYFIPLFTTVHCVRFRPSILVGLGLEGLTAFCIGVRAVWTRRK